MVLYKASSVAGNFGPYRETLKGFIILCFASRHLMSFSWCDFHYSYFQSA